MAEEFQESEVIFPESAGNEVNDQYYTFPAQYYNSRELGNEELRRKKKKKKKNSVPMNIPENVAGNSWFQLVDSDFFDDEYDDEEIEPPHVIIGRRIARKMAFSVCSGNGRTLKGRDLSEVRNSILRKTGFLET